MGEEGFSSDSSLLYHRRVPSAMVDARTWDLPDQTTDAEPARSLPRHLKLHDLFPGDGWQAHRRGHRPAARARQRRRADQLRRRRGRLAALPQRRRRRVRLRREPARRPSRRCSATSTSTPATTSCCPRSTTHRWVPTGLASRCGSTPSRRTATSRRPSATCRGTASSSSTRRTASATCGRPTAPQVAEEADVEVYVKHRGAGPGGLAGTVHVVPEHPFDVVGWDGCLYPYAFNVADFEPITGRVHQPPPVHQVFEGPNFVVCNFVPRKVDYHPLADPGAVLPLQRRQRRDHVLRRAATTRRARAPASAIGSISVHPGGHSHGPQPSAIEGSLGAE